MSELKKYGTASYYDEGGTFKVGLLYCRVCDIIKREINQKSLVSHYNAASYVDLRNERKFFYQRKEFFNFILDKITIEFDGRGELKLLDFGCAYGHLMEIADKRGYEVSGVELNKGLVEHVSKKGFKVYGEVDVVEGKFNVVVLLDSLYCIPQPLDLLKKIQTKLTDDGLICIRIANRNWILKVAKLVFRKKDFGYMLGDATIGYSYKSISKLLDLSGFSISKVIINERGKTNLGLKKRIFYYGTTLLTSISMNSLIITPGIIILARKK